jgi:hypothetical protein
MDLLQQLMQTKMPHGRTAFGEIAEYNVDQYGAMLNQSFNLPNLYPHTIGFVFA